MLNIAKTGGSASAAVQKQGGGGSLEVPNRSAAGPGKGASNAKMRELDAQINGTPTPNTPRATEHPDPRRQRMSRPKAPTGV